MANRLQEAAENALPKLPSSLANLTLPRILPAPLGSDPKMRAGIEEGNGNSPIYAADQHFTDPDYTPQLLGHELYHDKVNNLPPKLRSLLPAGNPSDPYNYGGTAGLRKVNGDPLKLSNEQGAAAMQTMIAAKQNGEKLDPIYSTFEQKFGALPLSVMQPTDPNQKGINTMARNPGLPAGYSMATGKILQAQDLKPVKAGSGTPQYSDLPPGATIVHDPGQQPQYSDLPPGATVVSAGSVAPPAGTLAASTPESWLHQAEDDFTQGGNRTILGRTLGTLQGRGGKGYSGIDSGVSKPVANFMGSPELGLIHALEGESDTLHGHPIDGGLKTAGGILEGATIPSAFMGGPGAEAAIDTIPSTKYAGKIFNSLTEDLAAHPIPLTDQTLQPLQRATELGVRGGTLPKPVSDLLTRSQMLEPMSYPEIRDYQSNLSDLSRSAKDSLNGKMLGQIGKVNHGVYQDIYDALSPTGRADDYAQAMKEFRQAQQLKSGLKKTAIPLATGVGGTIFGPTVAHYLKGLF